MDYLCAKYGSLSFSRFGFIVRTDRITESHTEADDRYTHATTVSVSNNTVNCAYHSHTLNYPVCHVGLWSVTVGSIFV